MSASRTELGLLTLLLSVALAATARAQPAPANSAERRIAPVVDHSSSPSALPPLDPTKWSRAELGRIDFLESQIVCRCPKENWSKTLAACPDACADEQKRMVRESVRAGEPDEAIFKAQLELARTRRVLADPGRAGASTNFALVALGLGAVAAVVGVVVVRSWTRRASTAAPAATRGAEPSDISDEEIARIERELEGLR